MYTGILCQPLGMVIFKLRWKKGDIRNSSKETKPSNGWPWLCSLWACAYNSTVTATTCARLSKPPPVAIHLHQLLPFQPGHLLPVCYLMLPHWGGGGGVLLFLLILFLVFYYCNTILYYCILSHSPDLMWAALQQPITARRLDNKYNK